MENNKTKGLEARIVMMEREIMVLKEENKILDNRIDDLILLITKSGKKELKHCSIPINNKLTGLVIAIEENFNIKGKKDTIYKISEFVKLFEGYSIKDVKEVLYSVYKIKEVSKCIREGDKIKRGFKFYPIK